jgi:hypothetical protein
MPRIGIHQMIVQRDADELLTTLWCTKSRAWAYEQEWRGLHQQAGTLFCYGPLALKAVYFGPDITRYALEVVCLVLHGQNPDVELWLGERSKREFKVEFRRTEYTPYHEAKRRGLV